MCRGLDAAESYHTARAMGFTAVEHNFPYDNPADVTQRLLEAHGLEMSLLYAPCQFEAGERGFACTPGREDEFEAGVETAVAYAQRVGCPLLGILAGEIRDQADRSRHIDVLTRNLARAAKIVRSAGMEITLEPITSARMPDFALHTLDQAASVIDAIGDDAIKLCFDTFHVALEKGGLINMFDAHASRINYIQIGNPPDRRGPGCGELDLNYFLDYVLGRCTATWISCEYICEPRRSPADELKWAAPLLASGRLRL